MSNLHERVVSQRTLYGGLAGVPDEVIVIPERVSLHNKPCLIGHCLDCGAKLHSFGEYVDRFGFWHEQSFHFEDGDKCQFCDSTNLKEVV